MTVAYGAGINGPSFVEQVSSALPYQVRDGAISGLGARVAESIEPRGLIEFIRTRIQASGEVMNPLRRLVVLHFY